MINTTIISWFPQSNIEAINFINKYCNKCSKAKHTIDGNVIPNSCPILKTAVENDGFSFDYPNQWQIKDKKAICTSFETEKEPTPTELKKASEIVARQLS